MHPPTIAGRAGSQLATSLREDQLAKVSARGIHVFANTLKRDDSTGVFGRFTGVSKRHKSSGASGAVDARSGPAPKLAW
jgi:hypothetical protein